MSQKKLLIIAGMVVLLVFGYLLMNRQGQQQPAEIVPATQDTVLMREESEMGELFESEQEVDQLMIDPTDSTVMGVQEEKSVEQTTQEATAQKYVLFCRNYP